MGVAILFKSLPICWVISRNLREGSIDADVSETTLENVNLKLKLEVKSYHLETEFMEKDFGCGNVAFSQTVNEN